MRFLLALALLIGPSLSASAQSTKSAIPVVTRLVAKYVDFEGRLIDACARQDQSEIGKLVGDAFEFRSLDAPGAPIPRADWVSLCLKTKTAAPVIDEMAVHDFGEIQVVSYRLRSDTSRQAPKSFVDIWKGSSADPVLLVRYAASASVAPNPPPVRDQLPTGRN